MENKLQNFQDNCNVLKILNDWSDMVFNEINIPPHINLNLEKSNNTLKQRKFAEEGKFHFLTAIKINYKTANILEALNLFIEELRNLLYNNLMSEKCFEKHLEKLLEWFNDELSIHKLKEILFFNKCNDYKINNKDIIFLLFEFCYKSPILTHIYKFPIADVRRQTILRLETLIYTFLDSTTYLIENFNKIIINQLKYNYKIEETLIYLQNREIILRRNFIDDFFFNVEYFLSEIRKFYNIKGNEKLNKKDLLKEILKYFNIKSEISLYEIKEIINKRCNETKKEILKLLDGTDIKKDFIVFHNLYIQIRNSLHSNGKANKNTEYFEFGKIIFHKMKKNEFHNNMSIFHIVILSIIEIIAIEKIVDKTIETDFIIDEYFEELKKYKNEHLSFILNC